MRSTKIKTKTEKGITLIALIITIVVLMILAAVAINSITNEGIISKAEGAANKYTEEQKKEQAMLDYYQAVLEEKLWTQNGTEITRKGQTTPIEVGDEVKLKIGDKTPTKYSANGVSDWIVFGVENGQLLLISKETVGSVTLKGREGDNKGVKILNDECKKYVNPDYAYDARSINGYDFKTDWWSGYLGEEWDEVTGEYTDIDAKRKLPDNGTYWVADNIIVLFYEADFFGEIYTISVCDGWHVTGTSDSNICGPMYGNGLWNVVTGYYDESLYPVPDLECELTYGLRPIIYLNYLVDVEKV